MNYKTRDYLMMRRDERNRDYNDYRQGVRGTGRYGIGGSQYRGGRDYRDYEYERDYGEEDFYLTRHDYKAWEHKLKNADGSHGKHFDDDKLISEAKRYGVRFEDYSEDDFIIATNMLYSDYCEVFKNIITQSAEPMFYVKMAKAFLEDKDAKIKGSEKLAMYYYCFVDDEEDDERRR